MTMWHGYLLSLCENPRRPVLAVKLFRSPRGHIGAVIG